MYDISAMFNPRPFLHNEAKGGDESMKYFFVLATLLYLGLSLRNETSIMDESDIAIAAAKIDFDDDDLPELVNL